jgi:hypothetical protein
MFGVDDAEVPKKKYVAPFFRLKKIHFSAQLLEMGGGWPADGQRMETMAASGSVNNIYKMMQKYVQ